MSTAPEKAGKVVGLALALVAALALAAQVLGPAPRSREPAEVFARVFDLPAELPFELAFRDAVELTTGDLVAVLAAPGFEDGIPLPEPEPEEPQENGEEAEPSEDAESAEETEAEPQRDTPPVEVVLTVYRRAAPVVGLFSNLRVEEHREGGEGHWTVEFGRLEWGRYQANFVHERVDLGSTFRDSIRVNLSAGERFAVLSAQWPVGRTASTERMEELLRELRLRGTRSVEE